MLTLVALVAVIAFLVSRQTEQRGTVEFYAAADESAATHASAAASLQSTLERLGPLMTRQELTTSLADITEKAAEADAMLDLEVPSTVGNAYGTMTTASASWSTGTAEFERVIIGIMDGEIVTGAELRVQAAIDTLRVGDVGYEMFQQAAAEQTTDVTLPVFEGVRYVDPVPDQPLLYDAQNIILKVQSAYNLAPRHNVAVVGTTDPEPVGDRGGVPVVPFAETIGIRAVVSNLGNEVETDVEVVLTLFAVDAGTTESMTRTIDSLAGGSSTTVAFDDLGIAPGGLYEATVTVRIATDNDLDDNVWSFTFIWNEES